jgi:hypothetical protein
MDRGGSLRDAPRTPTVPVDEGPYRYVGTLSTDTDIAGLFALGSEGRREGRRSGLADLPRLPSRDGLYEQLYDRHNPNWRPGGVSSSARCEARKTVLRVPTPGAWSCNSRRLELETDREGVGRAPPAMSEETVARKPYGRFTSSSRRQRPSRHQSAVLCPPGCPHDRTHHACPFAQGVPSFGTGVQRPSFVRTTRFAVCGSVMGFAVCGSVTDGADWGTWDGAVSAPSPAPASLGSVRWASVSGKERRWGSQAANANPNGQTPSHTLVIGMPFASASRACSAKRSVVLEQLRTSFGTCSTFCPEGAGGNPESVFGRRASTAELSRKGQGRTTFGQRRDACTDQFRALGGKLLSGRIAVPRSTILAQRPTWSSFRLPKALWEEPLARPWRGYPTSALSFMGPLARRLLPHRRDEGIDIGAIDAPTVHAAYLDGLETSEERARTVPDHQLKKVEEFFSSTRGSDIRASMGPATESFLGRRARSTQ